MRAVARRIRTVAPSFSSSRVVSGLLLSVGRLIPQAPELVDLLPVLVASARSSRDFDALATCQLTRAAASLSIYDPKMLEILPLVAEHILASHRPFAAEQVVMILVSAARSSAVAEQLRHALPSLLKTGPNLRQLGPQDLAALAWAAEKLSIPELSHLSADVEKQLRFARPLPSQAFVEWDGVWKDRAVVLQ